jgi:uncharacterized protein YdbL (DUF1318 family)
MRKSFFVVVVGMIFGLACARVRIEAPQEPIKVDVSMRLDIYQHVVKDIDSIEDIVSGPKGKMKNGGHDSLLRGFITNAYAQEALNPEIENAALRRKERHDALASWEAKGVIGENKLGLVELKIPQNGDPAAEELIVQENKDRMLIYREVSRKNSVLVEEVQKLYTKRLHKDAPVGTPLEVFNESTKEYAWEIKK